MNKSKQQVHTFMETREIKWAISLLKEKNVTFDNLEAWQNGVLLITTLGLVTNKTITKYFANPKNRIQMIENVNIAMSFMSQNNIMVKCSPQDFVDGNDKVIQSTIYRLYLFANGKSVHTSSQSNFSNLTLPNANQPTSPDSSFCSISPSTSNVSIASLAATSPDSVTTRTPSPTSVQPAQPPVQHIYRPAQPAHQPVQPIQHLSKPLRPVTSPPSAKTLVESVSHISPDVQITTSTTTTTESVGEGANRKPTLPGKGSFLSKSNGELPGVDPEMRWKRRLLDGRPMSGSGFNIGRARNSFIDTSTSSSALSGSGAMPINIMSRQDSTSSVDSQISSSPMSSSWSMARIEVNEADKTRRKKQLFTINKLNPSDLERYNNPDLLPTIIKCQSYIRRYQAVKILKKRIKDNLHRNRCFKEILSSEENYVIAIEMIVNVFYQQILFNTKVSPTPYLVQDQINTIFSTVNEIYSFNTELLGRLRQRAKDWSCHQKIGDIFVSMAPYLKLYKTYCLNYDTAIECLQKAKKNEKFHMFIKACLDHPENPMKQSLESLLITVVQRIPRYILLLQDLANHTWKNHVDYESLKTALKHVQAVAGEVNASIKMAESQSKVLAIQRSLIGWDEAYDLVNPSRHFIKQGIIYQCHLDARFAKSLVETFYFAFNDSLLIAEKKDSSKYQFRYFFELYKTRVKDVEDSQVLQNAIHLISGETTAMISFYTPQLKKTMIEFIEKGKANYANNKDNRNPSQSSISTSTSDISPQSSYSSFSDLRQVDGSFNVQIKKTESKKLPGKKPFTVYIIDIVNETSGGMFSVSKRYSDFDSLHKKLKRKFPDSEIRDLPKKHLINSLGTNTVESRRVMLEVFLQDLFQKENIKNSNYLWDFISKDAETENKGKELKKNPSEASIDGADLIRQKSKDEIQLSMSNSNDQIESGSDDGDATQQPATGVN